MQVPKRNTKIREYDLFTVFAFFEILTRNQKWRFWTFQRVQDDKCLLPFIQQQDYIMKMDNSFNLHNFIIINILKPTT